MKCAIIYGSVREERVGIRAAKFMKQICEGRGHEAVIIDPKEYNLPLLDKRFSDFASDAPENMREIAKHLEWAESFIVVTAEYNHAIPSALKNLLDHFRQEYKFKPSGVVSYSVGGFGGVRAAMDLCFVLPALGTVALPTTFPISKVHEALDEEGNAVDKAYENRVVRFMDELEWYSDALSEARKKGVPK